MAANAGAVILDFGGSGDPVRDDYIGGSQVAFDALEQLPRQLAVELGKHGIRLVTLRTGGIPESPPDDMPGWDAIVDISCGALID